MKVLVVGCKGQLGNELMSSAPAGYDVTGVDIEEIDIVDMQSVNSVLMSLKPQLVINAAAYTAVDKAESQTQLAYAINAEGAANLAETALQIGARLFHVSTDFVFDGAATTPYPPQTAPAPLSVYGASKAAGEQRVLRLDPAALVVRTAWVYSRFGGNFVKTMLRLMAEREELSIVCDQIGSPSWAAGLAKLLWRCASLPDLRGIYHWTDEGSISWYDFAEAIQEEALSLGLLDKACRLQKITTLEYPSDAARPAYSVLDCCATECDADLKRAHWRDALGQMLLSLQVSGEQ